MRAKIARPRLDVVSIGALEASTLERLQQHFSVSTTEIEPRDGPFRWSDFADPINHAIDEAPGWVLLLGQEELIPEPLAGEIARVAVDKPVAWAFRIPVSLHYAGGKLYRGSHRSGGEIRLFHGRRCRFLPRGQTRELQSKGTVIRIGLPLERVLYPSSQAHLAALRTAGIPHSLPRRTLIVLSRIWRDRGKVTLRSIRYHWLEAGWDRGRLSDES